MDVSWFIRGSVPAEPSSEGPKILEQINALSRDEFDAAVKEALRHFQRSDLLVANKLLNTRLARRRGLTVAGANDLRAALAETAEILFANARDEKIHRVLKLTWFEPASKQEAAAEQLGLSFSTYRRYLASGTGRLTEYLWHLEQSASSIEPPGPRAAEPANFVGAGDRSRVRNPLSLIVLPFLNLSPDAEFGYFVDGVVDNLMTELYRALPDSFIVSRSTAFTYKDRDVPVRQIGDDLQVRYVLEGSVLTDTSRVRVNAQLIDARTDEHLWAERFDKSRKDPLQAQEEIVGRLARNVGFEMLRGAAGRVADEDDGDAIDLVMRARALATDVRQNDSAARAVSLFRRALAKEPENVEAMIGLASTRVFQLLFHCHAGDRDLLLDEAEALISRAAVLAPHHIGVLKVRCALSRARGRFEEATIATRAVIEQSPGDPTVYREMGLNKLYLGKPLEAAEWFRRADRVAPGDPMRWTWLQGLGYALMQLGQDAEAKAVWFQAVDNHPGWLRGKALLAASEALAGDIGSANRHMANYVENNPKATTGIFADEDPAVPRTAVSPGYRRGMERLREGLRRAGMPN
jgi:TolB-like protein